MERVDFNGGWVYKGKEIRLPHDAMLASERTPDSPGKGAVAYFTGGVYTYEKTFDVPAQWQGDAVLLEFEGVYKDTSIFINGHTVEGIPPYGYIPFVIDCGPYLQFAKANTIMVVAHNEDMPNSRWYTGGGIYRPVWLYHGPKNHIRHEGVQITTQSLAPACVHVDTAVIGEGDVGIEILHKGIVVATGSGVNADIDIPRAKLWSCEAPNLYECRVSLNVGGAVVDEWVGQFGIRRIEWSSNGFFVNGKETLLRGGCVHHDNGILGARCYADAEWRRVRIMKEAGYNAIRSSHNPASKAMLQACDALGMYMIDETWDMSVLRKSKHDYADHFPKWHRYDIEAMVRRDYNHPSVIMYSIGNEVADPATEQGIALEKEMVDLCHSLDSTRPVTAGINLMIVKMASDGKGIYKEEGGLAQGGDASDSSAPKKEKATSSTLFNMMASVIGTNMNKSANGRKADMVTSPGLDMLDIAGYNYASGRYPKEGKKHPKRVIYGSETFPQDIARNWSMVEKYPYLVGDFMWTAWDYLGEAGIASWTYDVAGGAFEKPFPWLLSETGAIDITGHIGAEAHHAAAVWGLDEKPYIGVRPVNHPGVKPRKTIWRGTNAIASWSWQGCEGNPAVVEVFSSAYSVELLLNGKRVGKKNLKKCKAVFRTAYRSGKLEAVAYDLANNELSRSALISAEATYLLRVLPEVHNIGPGELGFISIHIADEAGVVESNADVLVDVSVSGGELLAFGSAKPSSTSSYLDGSFETHYGRALAVVRSMQEGTMEIEVRATGLGTQKAVLEVRQ